MMSWHTILLKSEVITRQLLVVNPDSERRHSNKNWLQAEQTPVMLFMQIFVNLVEWLNSPVYSLPHCIWVVKVRREIIV